MIASNVKVTRHNLGDVGGPYSVKKKLYIMSKRIVAEMTLVGVMRENLAIIRITGPLGWYVWGLTVCRLWLGTVGVLGR